MPDEYGIPTDQEIEKWLARWRPEWVEDVVHILQEDPEGGSKKIVELPWYTQENGFESWALEEERRLFLLEGRPILDLRGWHFSDEWPRKEVLLKGIVLPLAHLEGALLREVDLSGACLQQTNFAKATLVRVNLSQANLMLSNLSGVWLGHANLSETMLWGANLFRASLGSADLSRANLSGASLIRANLGGARIDGCILRSINLRSFRGYANCSSTTFFGRTRGKRKKETTWLFDKCVLKEQELEPKDAMSICSEIRLCFRDNGLFHKAAMYYEQEEYWRTRATWEEIGTWKGCLKKGNRWKSFLLLCRYILGERFMGYGEHPGYIIGWSSALVFLCAIIFFLFGFQYETAPRVFEPMTSSSFVFFSSEAWVYLLKCLRFSIENFVTLGFSKMQPAEGLSHWVASLEGIVGVLFVALATVTWARKAIRD